MSTAPTKPVGLDAYYREIFPGDTIAGPDGSRYTVDQFGNCKPLTGAGITSLGKLGEVTVVEHAPAPAPKPERPKHLGGKPNKSGYSQVGNITRRYGVTTREASAMLKDAGVEITHRGKNNKACIKVGDLPKLHEILEEKTGHRMSENQHRPNNSGVVYFSNIARSMKIKTYRLRELAEQGGFTIVKGSLQSRNDGIAKEDEARFREYVSPEAPQPVAVTPPPSDVVLVPPVDDADVVKAVEERGLWIRCLQECPGFSDDLLHNVLVSRGFYHPISFPQLSQEMLDAIKSKSLPVEIRPACASAPILPPDDLKRPVLATSDPAKVWSKFDAFLILEDKDLADELRRRGFEVCAVKHIQL